MAPSLVAIVGLALLTAACVDETMAPEVPRAAGSAPAAQAAIASAAGIPADGRGVSDLTVTNVTGSAATLSWTQVDDGAGDPAWYRLKYSTPTLTDWTTATIGCQRTLRGTGIGAVMSCAVEGLQPLTTYDFQLMSYRLENGVWVGALPSNHAAGKTIVPQGRTVQDLAIESSTRHTMTVRWTQVDDGTGNPASYRVKYAQPPILWKTATRSYQEYPFANYAHVCAATIAGTQIGAEMSCTIELLAAATTYEIQLMSFRVENGAWVTADESNIVAGATLPADAPGAVDDLQIIGATHHATQSSLTVRWTQVSDGTGQPARYRVKYGTPLVDWKVATIGCARTLVGDQVGAVMSCVIEGLPWGMFYDVQLMSYRVENGVWVGALPSNVDTAPVGRVPAYE